MEERLVPVNAIVGLAKPDGLNRAVLAEAGYEVVGLEIPCLTPLGGKVVVDVVLGHTGTGHLIACEAKSGSNIEVEQAKRYQSLEPRTLVRGASVTLRERVDPSVEVIYAAMSANADRVLYGLKEVGASFPVLKVCADKITLENGASASEPVRQAFALPVMLKAPVSRFIPFDHESSATEVEPFVRAALVAALSQNLQTISIAALTERAASHYVLYGANAQKRLQRIVADAAKSIASADRGTFEFYGSKANRDAFVKLLHSPEENDPRGRTQGYQRLARQGQSSPRRRRNEIPGQGSLLDELEKAENVDELTEVEEGESGDAL